MAKYIIGRAPNCDIVLNDGSVSRTHAELIVDGVHVTVRDLGSANGTFVNNVRVHDAVQLSGMDILKAGSVMVPWKNYTSVARTPQTVINPQPAPQAYPVYPSSPAAGMSGSSQNKIGIPNASATLVLGICSVVFSCLFVGLVLGIIGLSLGSKGKQIYNENPNMYSNFSMLNAGFICSIIGTAISSLYVLYYLIWVIILGTGAMTLWRFI